MGQTYELRCNCGYKKTVYTGEGLMAINLDMIRSNFTSEDLAGFEKALENGAYSYSYGQKIALCESCNDIVNINRLQYIDGGQQYFVVGRCSQCGAIAEPLDEPINCPLCKNELSAQETGLWD